MRHSSQPKSASTTGHFAPVTTSIAPKEKKQVTSDFTNPGAKIGLEIWRIEKLKAMPIKSEDHGKFHSGDSYLVLHTYTAGASRKYDLHFWLGESTSQDEAGTAAYKTVELDEKLGGAPVQHREVQGHESGLFLSYFKGGIQYLDGGIESGFKHVDKDAFTKRLLHLKGKRHVRSKEVPISYKSLNNGDVFVLDCGMTIYQLNGAEASKMEKAKGLEVTSNMNSNERGAKAKIVILEYPQMKGAPEMTAFWTELGGEGPIANAAEGGDDAEAERQAAGSVKLFRVTDSSGPLEMIPVPGRPLSKAQLDTNDCFIIDLGPQIFVWVGKGSTAQEKSSSMKFAAEYLKSEGKPDWTPIARVVEGGEPPNFKSHFSAWSEVSAPSKRPVLEKKASPQARVDVNAMHTSTNNLKVADRAAHKGTGEVTVWRVQDFKKAVVPKDQYGMFFSGDSYVVLYTEKRPGTDLHYVYFWQGRSSSTDEKGASALLARDLDDELHGNAIQVRVVQNKEPSHFISLFKNGLIIKQGGHPSAFRSLAQEAAHSEGGATSQLYHIKGDGGNATRAIEVPAKAGSLNSGDAFVVLADKGKTCHIWFGKGCSKDEKAVAVRTAEILTAGQGSKNTEVQEGSESDQFWSSLGGKGEYASAAALYDEAKEPRLFWGSNATGVFKVEELYNFSQDDLSDDDVYLLDCFNEVYVWVGSASNDVEKKMAVETAVDYVANAPDGRSKDTPIYRINAGSEPAMFTCHFHAWDASSGDVYTRKLRQMNLDKSNGQGVADVRQELKQAGDAKPIEGTYTFDQMTAKKKELDMANLEKYLTEDEFKRVTGSTRAEFIAFPAWKQLNIKKAKGLF